MCVNKSGAAMIILYGIAVLKPHQVLDGNISTQYTDPW